MDRITVTVPYLEDRKLAKAYNRTMEEASSEWVLMLDWDLFNCNPYWYDCCKSAIAQVGHDAGWITCVTNRIGSNSQKAPSPPTSHDITEHILYAKELHHKVNTVDGFGRLERATVNQVPGALSGFFILTNKTAWKAAGGFDERLEHLLGVDNHYSRDLNRAGYKLYCMSGLYFYHIYRQKRLYWRGRQ